jgi:hypothetical protein
MKTLRLVRVGRKVNNITVELLQRIVSLCDRVDGPCKNRETQSDGNRKVSFLVLFTFFRRSAKLTLVPAHRSFLDLRCKSPISTHMFFVTAR